MSDRFTGGMQCPFGVNSGCTFPFMLPTCPLGALTQLELEFLGFFFKRFSPDFLCSGALLSLTAGWPLSLSGWTGSGSDQSQASEQLPGWWEQEGGGGDKGENYPPPRITQQGVPASVSHRLPLPLVFDNPGGSQAVWSAWNVPGSVALRSPFRHHNFQITQHVLTGS